MRQTVKLELDKTEVIALNRVLSATCAAVLHNEKNVSLDDLEKAIKSEDFSTIEKLSTVGQEALICTIVLARLHSEVERQIDLQAAKA